MLKLRVSGNSATGSEPSILLIVKIVIKLWTSLQPKVFVAHTLNFGNVWNRDLAVLYQNVVLIEVKLLSVFKFWWYIYFLCRPVYQTKQLDKRWNPECPLQSMDACCGEWVCSSQQDKCWSCPECPLQSMDACCSEWVCSWLSVGKVFQQTLHWWGWSPPQRRRWVLKLVFQMNTLPQWWHWWVVLWCIALTWDLIDGQKVVKTCKSKFSKWLIILFQNAWVTHLQDLSVHGTHKVPDRGTKSR